MCSNGLGAVSPGVGPGAPTSLARRLHDVLDGLLSADLNVLGADEHAQLVASLVKAQSRLQAAVVDSVGAFDAAQVAAVSRHHTTKRWLEHRTRLSAGAASGLVRQSRALRDHLRGTRDALACGQISPQHASVITTVVRTVGVEHAVVAEPILLELARHRDPATVGKATAALLAEVSPDKAEKALHDAYERRGLRLRVVGDHGYLDGVFDLESTELISSALMPLMRPGGLEDNRRAEQRRADALLDIAQYHLAHAERPVLGGHRPHLSVVIDADQLPPVDGAGASGGALDVEPVGSERPQRGWVGVMSLPWTSTAVPASVARRWTCDAVLTPVVARLVGRRRHSVPITRDPVWLPLDVGRSQRTATPAQLKALGVRDGGCIHPGCSRTPAYCDAHHVVHWIDDGPTAVSNMVLLCRHHHRTLHAGHWTIHPDPGSPGLFWTRDAQGLHQAQTGTDRSPPSPVLAA